MRIVRTREKTFVTNIENTYGPYLSFLRDIVDQVIPLLPFNKVFDQHDLVKMYDFTTTPQAKVMQDCLLGDFKLTRFYPKY